MIAAAASVLAQASLPTPAASGLPSLPSLPSAPGEVTGSSRGFGDVLASAVEHLDRSQRTADALAVQAATGELRDVQDYVIAATEAQVTTELAVTVRNRAVEAFTQIMQMAI
jgi:flagellar hook-basal body complex protein FliE